ncbi:PAS domain-containing protein [Desulfobulbus rhabdoformis]|uniref:PAS domain-containing protein n=1 Tax=Desulfobulbus rhabdoformis TaxID=34032 RepID=UPI0019659722|nr:PAS domain-containing protein [Desulfobulbus rhabdoformis]MBM9615502.1 PAS domain-containing protein [Desulfobulbus rhabdoformis]
MPEQTKFIGQLAVLFIVTTILLLLMDRQMLVGPEDLVQWPFALLSLVLMIALFVVVAYLTNGRMQELITEQEKRTTQLNELNLEINQTKNDMEERVERRTFEISVANASLNREIAERMQAESEARRIKRQMELILESAGEGIFGLDVEGKVTFVNKAASKMLGWDPDDLVGQEHHALIHHTRADGSPFPVAECPIHQAYRDGKIHFGDDEVFWKRDGSSFQVEYISTPILENRKLTGAVVVFRDLVAFRKPLTQGLSEGGAV